ncbi:hypothetical protein ATE40_016250 [Serratia surfactantfaciens]|nr:hypothetical protein ATE40_016250 [Serratia surfactantfaciens]
MQRLAERWRYNGRFPLSGTSLFDIVLFMPPAPMFNAQTRQMAGWNRVVIRHEVNYDTSVVNAWHHYQVDFTAVSLASGHIDFTAAINFNARKAM